MANEQQGQDAAWNDFLEAKRRLLQSMLDFIQAAEKAFEGHVWITLGYPEGMKGWAAYCKDNFGQQATIMRQLPKSDRRQLLLEAKSAGFSDRTVAQIFGVSASTVRRATADDGKQKGGANEKSREHHLRHPRGSLRPRRHPPRRLHTFPHLMTNQNGKESHGRRRTRHGTRPPAAGDSQRPRRIRQRAAHSPRTGATTHEQACHRRMAARRRPRRCRDHRTEDTIGNQSMQPVHGTIREHRGPRKPVQGGLRMPQGRKRPRRRQHCLDLRRPR